MGQYEFPKPEWSEVSQQGEELKQKHEQGQDLCGFASVRHRSGLKMSPDAIEVQIFSFHLKGFIKKCA